MKYQPEALAQTHFDLVIIGGGVYGLCTAWDASLRGLKVAVLEKDDFSHACTAANYKLIHGGLRYLQHLDFKRMRVSIKERRNMMTMAPHMVSPVEFVIPCYGHGMKGPEVMAAALFVNDLMGFDRNKGIEKERQIPRGHLISKAECIKRIPGIDPTGITAGAVYYDAQMYSPERLALMMGAAAESAGACLANYHEVTRIVKEQGKVQQIEVLDKRSGESKPIKGNFFINMTGPWSEITRDLISKDDPERYVVRSKGVQVMTRKLAETGFTVQTKQKDTTAKISRGGRSLFVHPWRDTSFIGQSDKIFKGDPDDFKITDEDVQEFIDEFNEAYPAANLSMDDVVHRVGGMIPVGNDDPNAGEANISHRYEILDHEDEGINNMLSVIGVKYTISRYIAEQVMDQVQKKTGMGTPSPGTQNTQIKGGDIVDVNAEISALINSHALSKTVATHLVKLYGTQCEKILALISENPDAQLDQTLADSDEALRAEVIYAIREEMAIHVDDVLARRTDIATICTPSEACIQEVASLMGQELNWNQDEIEAEIKRAKTIYTRP